VELPIPDDASGSRTVGDPDTADLVRRAQQGDLAAFDRLYAAHVDRVYALCLRMSGQREQAERLTQDAFVRAWEKLRLFRGESAGARVWVRAASANVEVSGVIGGIDVASVTGSIRITGKPREAIAESMAGDIVIEAADPMTLRAKSAAGAVTVSGGARDASITTVTGDITVSNGVYQRGLFESIEGAIRFEGDLALAGDLEFINHAGPVELRLPANVSADFLVDTFRGAIENAFGSYPIRTRPDMRGELTFSRGSGSASVVIRTFKGRVSLKER